MRLCPSNPDRLYQQNHCGIYRLDRPATLWTRIGRSMPAEVGDVGFPLVVRPRDAATIWVMPMDGAEVWPRTSRGGKPVCRDANAGRAAWVVLDNRDLGWVEESFFRSVLPFRANVKIG